MLDTYMDRADAAIGYRPMPCTPVTDDARYFNGAFYATVIDRNAAEARANLAAFVHDLALRHKAQILKKATQ